MGIIDRVTGFYERPEYAQRLGYPANPRTLQALGLYPFFIPINKSEGTEVIIDKKRLIMLGSNNYLGMTTHPRVKEAAVEAIKKYGTGCTGSRLLNGTMELHIELEEALSRFVGKEKALVFSTGFQTNLGTITSLMEKDDVVITDKKAHASIMDGVILAKTQKRIQIRFFKHNDMSDLEKILSRYAADRVKMIVTDGVFSMDGDVANLPEIVVLAQKYNATIMVDDAHALGVLGGGRGSAAHFDCTDKVDLIMGTFSKSFASIGGFIAGRREYIHWIQHFARPYIFSASLPPANLAAAHAVLNIIQAEPHHIERLNQVSGMMKRELKSMGYNVGESQTPIIPIHIGDQFKTVQAWKRLYDGGVYTNVGLPPAVPPDSSLLRTSYMATHTNEQMEEALEAFRALKRWLDRFRK